MNLGGGSVRLNPAGILLGKLFLVLFMSTRDQSRQEVVVGLHKHEKFAGIDGMLIFFQVLVIIGLVLTLSNY